jgi:hypothetical protein
MLDVKFLHTTFSIDVNPYYVVFLFHFIKSNVEILFNGEANMPTCNLSELIHNIWLQQFVKRGAYLYVTTLDDYVQTFKQSAMYYVFLHQGHFKTSLDKDELCLHTSNHFNDPL